MRILARIITKSYRWVIISWLIVAIATGFLAIRLPAMLQGDGFNMDAENALVMEQAAERFGMAAETMFIVFDRVTDEDIESSLQAVAALGFDVDIVSPLDDETLYSEHLSYALLHFAQLENNMSKVVTQIRTAIADVDGAVLTGQSAITKDINTASQRDLMVAEAIGLPIAIIVLLLAFGTVVASLIPLIIGVSAVIVSFGVLTLLAGEIDTSVFILNIVPMLGLALSIDFALLFISRYREELRKRSPLAMGKQPTVDVETSSAQSADDGETMLIIDRGTAEAAVTTAIMTAGRAIIFSAFCVFIGLGAMLFIQVDIFRDIAVGGMLIVTAAVLSSITLLPSVLLALGPRINRWRLLRIKSNGADRWRMFANAVIKRPVIITIATTVVLVAALLPVLKMELTLPQIDSLPKSYESRQAYEKLEAQFNFGKQSPVYMIATRDGGWLDEAGLAEMKQWEEALRADPLVADVTTIYSLSGIESPEQWQLAAQSPLGEELVLLTERFIHGEQLFIPLMLNVHGASDQAQDWVRTFDEKYPEIDAIIGGQAKFNQEIFDEISDKIWLVISVIMASTFIVLMIAFRSILIPLKAILMNVVGLAATFGLLVYIFQYGHFGLPAGTIALIIPAIVFSLVFGLSMDYEVFLISRMQEEYYKTKDNDHATVEGLAMTSKIITSAALIMIVLTGSFAIADVMPIKQIGVGIAIAVAIDASIIRLLLVPSLMKLFGKWNWWMPFRKI